MMRQLCLHESYSHYEPIINMNEVRNWKTWHCLTFPVKFADGSKYESIRPLMKMLRKRKPNNDWKVIKHQYYGAFWEIKYCEKKEVGGGW